MGRNPDPTDTERNISQPDSATWRKVELRMQKATGKTLDITLLRPTTWIESTGAVVHKTIHLDMHEMDAVGPAEVVAIQPCPEIKPGPGQVVTGTFSHEPDDNLVNVYIEGLDAPIGCTNNHRFWSESRQEFVQADSLQQGEQVRTRTGGLTRISSVIYRPPEARVYNLEVHGEHVYEVSKNGVLVHHNSYVDLWRVVGADELADIKNLQSFRPKYGGLEIKSFHTTLDDVLEQGRGLYGLSDDPQYVVRVRINKQMFDALDATPLDNMPARTIQQGQYDAFNQAIRQIEIFEDFTPFIWPQ